MNNEVASLMNNEESWRFSPEVAKSIFILC